MNISRWLMIVVCAALCAGCQTSVIVPARTLTPQITDLQTQSENDFSQLRCGDGYCVDIILDLADRLETPLPLCVKVTAEIEIEDLSILLMIWPSVLISIEDASMNEPGKIIAKNGEILWKTQLSAGEAKYFCIDIPIPSPKDVTFLDISVDTWLGFKLGVFVDNYVTLRQSDGRLTITYAGTPYPTATHDPHVPECSYHFPPDCPTALYPSFTPGVTILPTRSTRTPTPSLTPFASLPPGTPTSTPLPYPIGDPEPTTEPVP